MAELVSGRNATSADALDAFLSTNTQQPWTPGGTVDCCLALAEWAIWLGYDDPAAHLRGAYTPGQGQLDILASNGGALELVRRCAESIGGELTSSPKRGTIGVVGSANNHTRQFGAIHDGEKWLTRTPSGWTPVSARLLAAWDI
jgi:hypothetical protein